MNRSELDAFCTDHTLTREAIAAALTLTGARPDGAAWRGFGASVLRGAGLGAVGAGMLFFVAANWQDCGVFGRFALLQAALLGCIAVALWRAPPALPGQAALILATLLTGGLLALFGQTYQTGADVHELFFTWALLALPFALAGLSGALWALWWGVLNIGLALLCGWLGTDHVFWRFIDGSSLDRSALLMLPCLLNLLAAAACVALRRTRFGAAAPPWLARLLASCGMLAGTAAALWVVLGRRFGAHQESLLAAHTAVLLSFAAISLAIGLATWRHRRDVFPLALLAASWIAISTCWLGVTLSFNDVGAFFVLALWVIVASTVAGLQLMRWLRQWQPGAVAARAAGVAA